MTQPTKNERAILALAEREGVIRPRDVEGRGLSRASLYKLIASGRLIQTGRGLYRLPTAEYTENHSLAEVSKRVPDAVVCLISALRFHNLTTELPAQVWIALSPKAWTPAFKSPKLRIVRFSGAALSEGVEVHRVEGVPVRIYSIGKTIADCFKFRNKIGTSVAVEALHDAWKARRVTSDELWRHAKICRVTNVIRPYLDSL